MTSAILQFILFLMVVGAVGYGVYRLARANGDLKDLQDQAKDVKGSISSAIDKLPKL